MTAQLEDGYTRIANELLEALSKARINGTQANIAFFIFRYTYGFHRKCHELGNAFIAEGTSNRKDQVKRELNRLIEMKIVQVYEESTHIKSRVIGINTKTSEWEVNTKLPQGAKKTPGIENNHREGAKIPPPPGGQLPPQEIYSFKDNLKDIQEEETAMDAYRFSFKKLMYTGHIQNYVMQLLERGLTDSFIREVFLEMGERGIGADVNYMKKVADDWIAKGIATREEAKSRKAGVNNAEFGRRTQGIRSGGNQAQIARSEGESIIYKGKWDDTEVPMPKMSG